MITIYFMSCMTEEQLTKEHRRLVIEMHPDRNPDDPDATAKFQEMQAQYEERLAELRGDYTKSAKGRERRAREERERQERERKEREQSRVVEAIKQARQNMTADFQTLKAGNYIYACKVTFTRQYEWTHLSGDEVLRTVLQSGIADKTVVLIETIIDVDDYMLMDYAMSDHLNGIFGGRETLQQANPMGGVPKTRKVAKVVMFRSQRYCLFGNPMGDMHAISDYYVPVGYETMFSDYLHRLQADMERERIEAERKEQERKARLTVEQQPLIDEWQDKLIAVSAALSDKEKAQVALENLKTMLRTKFPGTKFKITDTKDGQCFVRWTDGPRIGDEQQVELLFGAYSLTGTMTPWEERFGGLSFYNPFREMSTLVKATILQQLGQVTDAFTKSGYDDDVAISDTDWMTLHLMVGVNPYDTPKSQLCPCYEKPDGTRRVIVSTAVRYIFDHTSYVKPKKPAKKKSA